MKYKGEYKMVFAARTHTGRIRKNNEDCFYIPGPLSCVSVTPSALPSNVMIIADGMGGHAAGEVASQTAVAEALRALAEIGEGNTVDALKTAVMTANGQIYAMSRGRITLRGMGTTLTVAVLYRKELYIGHVGDSRAYLFDKDKLIQLTKDHTFVANLVANGCIKPEEVTTHPHRNVITRAVGTHAKVEPDVIRCSWSEGNILLLCSDGLTEYMIDEDILRVLSSRSSLKKKVDDLVRLSLSRGGADNITAVAALNMEAGGNKV
ncbi:MAG: Stp1/IreP family PP2C-type Ser/Thr phosphatase [Bacillota bacterium]|nr:Stp1/IreP family PP2C-type Ser/Thr phosphatase [Bacillota bacterium]